MNCRDALMLRSTDVAIAECDQRRMESTVMTVPLTENMGGNGKGFQTRDSNTSGKESVAPASKPAKAEEVIAPCGFGNPRYSRLRSLRYTGFFFSKRLAPRRSASVWLLGLQLWGEFLARPSLILISCEAPKPSRDLKTENHHTS